MFFNSWMGLLRVVVISACAYASLVIILRISGKRTLAKLNAFDLVVTVALGSTLATVLLSKDVALAEGVLAFAMLALLQFLVSKGSLYWKWFGHTVRSEPALLLKNGRFLHAQMRNERVNQNEVEEAIRTSGLGRIEDVAAVVLETDGSFSVIPKGGDGELTALDSVPRRDED